VRTRLPVAAAGAACVLAIVPAVAQGAIASVQGPVLQVDLPAPPSTDQRTNAVQVTPLPDGGAIVAVYGPTPVPQQTTGPGCQQVATGNAPGTAPIPAFGPATYAATCSLSGVRVIGGTLKASGNTQQGWRSTLNLPTKVVSTGTNTATGPGDVIVTGPAGDTITGANGGDLIDAGGAPYEGQQALPPSGDPVLDDPLRNTVNGGDGADSFVLDGQFSGASSGRDVLNGGAGIDSAKYTSRFGIGTPGQAGVTVTLDGQGNDGDQSIDQLDSTAVGEGDNVMPDVELVEGTKREDTLIGNASRNILSGGEAKDTLTGGADRDTILSREPASAGSGIRDTISCGTPNASRSLTGVIRLSDAEGDQLFSDLADVAPSDCENVEQMAVDEPAAVRIAGTARRARGKRLRVRLTCPRKAGRTCKGALQLAGRRSGSRAAGFSIKRGRSRTVTLRLSAGAAAALARPRVAARLVSKEKGLKGDVTRVRLVRVRR
jgi:hypothetical protein